MYGEQIVNQDYSSLQAPAPRGLPVEYRDDCQSAKIGDGGLEGGGCPPWYDNDMGHKYRPEECPQYQSQKFEQPGAASSSVSDAKFSSEGSNWVRPGEECSKSAEEGHVQSHPMQTNKRESEIVHRSKDGRKYIKLEGGQGSPPQQRVSNSQFERLSMQNVESGVRVTKEPKAEGGLSVFYATGSGSIWSKVNILNEKKLCYECKKEKWRDKITPLCKDCYKKLCNYSGSTNSKKECTYCRVEFLQHRILKKAFKVFNKEICMDCCKNLCKHNTAPVRCHFCDCWSAWNSHLLCDRCSFSREQFGEPFPCDMCRKTCAFDRGEDSRKKVDGRMFCYLCTIKYKRLKYEEMKKTHSEYKKAEEALKKANVRDAASHSSPQSDDKKAALGPDGSVDWKAIAQERTLLYEKAKQDLAEFKTKELSKRIETGSLIAQLKEMNENLEKKSKGLEDKVLKLNAEINDWQLRLDNICEEKNKQIRLLKEEKKQALQEMESLIEELEAENKHLKVKMNSSNP